MSQVHYQDTELADVARRSRVVVVARPTGDPVRNVEMFIGEGHPPYVKTMSVWVIDEVVWNQTTSEVSVGDRIEVAPAHWEADLAGHRMYYIDGIAESPIFDRYNGGEVGPEDPRILFLYFDNGHSELRFAIAGGQEAVDELETVRSYENSAPGEGGGIGLLVDDETAT